MNKIAEKLNSIKVIKEDYKSEKEKIKSSSVYQSSAKQEKYPSKLINLDNKPTFIIKSQLARERVKSA